MRKISLKQWLLYGIVATFTWLPNTNYAQAIKRQCISSYGSGVTTDNLIIGQTAGQCYATKSAFSNENAILQGFQQPNTFSVEDISLPSLKNLNVSVYPSPASYSITITSTEMIEQSYIRVVDLNGKHVFSEKINNLQLYDINCESWANGVYLITIFDSLQNAKTLSLIISK
jgi:hypothetical protein